MGQGQSCNEEDPAMVPRQQLVLLKQRMIKIMKCKKTKGDGLGFSQTTLKHSKQINKSYKMAYKAQYYTQHHYYILLVPLYLWKELGQLV